MKSRHFSYTLTSLQPTYKTILILRLFETKNSNSKNNFILSINILQICCDSFCNGFLFTSNILLLIYSQNKHSDACIYLPPYKLDVLKIVEYKFSCEMEAHVEVTSLMFDCNTFKDKRHLLILVGIILPSKELQFCHFIMQTNSK